MESRAAFTIVALPGGRCPNPNCGQDIGDWHTEWLLPPDRYKLDQGQAAVDCPVCGAWVMIPGGAVGGLAPAGHPRVTRKRSQLNKWAIHSQVTPIDLDAYFHTPNGSLYQGYDFDR